MPRVSGRPQVGIDLTPGNARGLTVAARVDDSHAPAVLPATLEATCPQSPVIGLFAEGSRECSARTQE